MTIPEYNNKCSDAVYLNEISRCCQYSLNKDNILIDTIILKLEAAHFQGGQCEDLIEKWRGRTKKANLYGSRHFEKHYIPNRWPPEQVCNLENGMEHAI